MKSYSFYFNTSDWLASPAVRMMSKAERGVYIGLLALAWESPIQGTLPASTDKVRRLAEMSLDEWAESGETLLEKFPLSECGTYRFNPRLLVEAAKEQARSDKAKKSADMRWQSERNANASKNNANAPKKVCLDDAQVKLSKVKSTTNVVPASKEELKANLSNDLTARLASLTDTSGEIVWSESILNKPEYFAKIARKLITAPDVDIEHYRRAMLLAAEANNLSRDVKGWQSWVSIFLTNQLQRGPLLTVAAATVDLTQPTPKNQLPLPGTDCTGRHIVLPNTGDANMNRMYAANYERNYPNAIIHTTR